IDPNYTIHRTGRDWVVRLRRRGSAVTGAASIPQPPPGPPSHGASSSQVAEQDLQQIMAAAQDAVNQVFPFLPDHGGDSDRAMEGASSFAGENGEEPADVSDSEPHDSDFWSDSESVSTGITRPSTPGSDRRPQRDAWAQVMPQRGKTGWWLKSDVETE